MLKPNRKTITVAAIAFATLGLIAAAMILSIKTHRRDQDRIAFRKWEETRLLSALKRWYFIDGSLLDTWPQLEASKAFTVGPDDLNAFMPLYPGNSAFNDRFDPVMADIFREARTSAERQRADWDQEVKTARKPLDDLRGDLRAQLGLFFSPDFNANVATPFLEDLRDHHGVAQTTISEFIRANGLMRDGDFLSHHPEQAINHPDFIPITKMRAESQLQQARSDLERLRDEILRQVTATSQPATVP